MRSMILSHLPQAHLLPVEVRKLLFPLRAVVFTAAALRFVIPARCDLSVNLQLQTKALQTVSLKSRPAFQSRSLSSLLGTGLPGSQTVRRALCSELLSWC